MRVRWRRLSGSEPRFHSVRAFRNAWSAPSRSPWTRRAFPRCGHAHPWMRWHQVAPGAPLEGVAPGLLAGDPLGEPQGELGQLDGPVPLVAGRFQTAMAEQLAQRPGPETLPLVEQGPGLGGLLLSETVPEPLRVAALAHGTAPGQHH